MREEGEALGRECNALDVAILLGPAVTIKRSPLCGRNFEYFSEDPYLAGKLAAAYINGLQSQNVGASLKHFACNNQETARMSGSSELDERTLREIYLPAFEISIRESQPWTVMCSYNKINGTYASANKRLLTDILRDEFGFDGFVVSDWGAVHDRVAGVAAGLDLEMPFSGGETDAQIVKAVQDGTLNEADLDKAVCRILRIVQKREESLGNKTDCDLQANHDFAVKAESESAVLLENNGLLPFREGMKAAYIGPFAKKPRYQGGGSSHINPCKVTGAFEAALAKGRDVSYSEGFPLEDLIDEALMESAVKAAQAADVAVIFAGLPDSFESEGYDRLHMRLPSVQNELIKRVTAAQPNTVVVLHNGSPVECPWADNVASILEMYLGGEGVGEAADLLLWGEANPSGHLPESFPFKLADNPSFLNFPGQGGKVRYGEGIYAGYRYYDAKEMPVRWAFGHGLSYTDFEYSGARVSANSMDDDTTVIVSVDVANTGSREGKEVVMLFVSDETGTPGRHRKS
ncbi:MAG: glycoside hydrolase family 3 C-terminal domain-containing protein [Clostridiales bacterium]|nr:glycoside hydrolase family 3 C-terminal domain-containing protein [Clostridiales bacterium]